MKIFDIFSPKGDTRISLNIKTLNNKGWAKMPTLNYLKC